MSQPDHNLEHLRHSAAHLLAAAVLVHHPDAQLTLGPATENGFYYDINFLDTFSEDEFEKIEETMYQLLSDWDGFSHREVAEAEARTLFAGNPFKLELIDGIVERGEPITLYTAGAFTDLCRGGHVDEPAKALQHFKLLSVAGAYWRGDEKNPMLTRIYGTAFPTAEELSNHLVKLEEARLRDHKVVGKELGLFTFSETVGKGLPLWTPKGATVRRILERFIVDEEIKRGYLHVYTPDIANLDLYKKSGHYPYYKDSMYAPITIDDEEFMLRPMTCPHHFELYLSQPHSYRDLPMRIAELAQLYRYEQSGELTGLLRVRTFCLADAHIICADDDQAKKEVAGALDLIEYIAGVFGLKMGENYSYRLSLGDRSDTKKYFNDPDAWDIAEQNLREVLQERQSIFVEAPGEGAFYGPKIDVQMRNVLGKEDTAFTVQYDFVMPQRFELNYINADGQQQQARVIHRSSIGALERVMAFLIEHYGGAFPAWLAPVQATIVPVHQDVYPYADELGAYLKAQGVRVEISTEAETMQNRIRKAEQQKVPFILVVGGKEADRHRSGELNFASAVRGRGNQNLGVLSAEQLLEKIQEGSPLS